MSPARTTLPSPPVVIGGLGGSGTRLVAQLVEALGFDLGADRNESLDSRLFALLFKRPRWYRRATAHQIDACLDAFDAFSHGRPSLRAQVLLLEAFVESARYGRAHASPWDAPLRRLSAHTAWPLRSVLLAELGVVTAGRERGPRWGWKEPNTHVYLEPLIRHYPGLKYIHVMRHGLDMTLSDNHAQFCNWAELYDPSLKSADGERPTPRQALEYWLLANERAVALGRSALGPRFLSLSYDALCADPKPGVEALCAFLGESASAATLARLCTLPSPPQSIGRRGQLPEGTFTPEQLERVRNLGFSV